MCGPPREGQARPLTRRLSGALPSRSGRPSGFPREHQPAASLVRGVLPPLRDALDKLTDAGRIGVERA